MMVIFSSCCQEVITMFTDRNDRKYWSKRQISKCVFNVCRVAHVKISLCKIHATCGPWHWCITVMYFSNRGTMVFYLNDVLLLMLPSIWLPSLMILSAGKLRCQESLFRAEPLLCLKHMPAVRGWRNGSSLMLLHMLHGETKRNRAARRAVLCR